jgi:hypothetical protein
MASGFCAVSYREALARWGGLNLGVYYMGDQHNPSFLHRRVEGEFLTICCVPLRVLVCCRKSRRLVYLLWVASARVFGRVGSKLNYVLICLGCDSSLSELNLRYVREGGSCHFRACGRWCLAFEVFLCQTMWRAAREFMSLHVVMQL